MVILLYAIPLHSFLETSSQAVPQLKWLGTGLSPLRLGFTLREVHVGLMVNNLALGFSSRSFTNACISLYTYSVALVCERTIPTERPPLVGEVSANFCG